MVENSMDLSKQGDNFKMAAPVPAPSCINIEHGCSTNMFNKDHGCSSNMFDCLVHLWEWFDPQEPQSQFMMENKKTTPATQQPLTQQNLMAHHVHPGEQMYSHQHPQLQYNSPQQSQLQPNGVMHQLLQSQYHSNMDARSPLLENRHELYGTGHNHDYARQYGANENYNYPQSPPGHERPDLHTTDHNVNHELLQNMPKGYNAEVYQDYLKRNPPKDTNQIYQNHQPMYNKPNANQYCSKPYLPYSNRIGPQSNTELLRRQYNEIQQMKLQQQMLYQNQAQMHQQQKFAERQILLQQIHGVQPPPNLQNSIYSDGSYRDLDRYASNNDFKEYSSTDIQKEVDQYAKNNEFKDVEKYNRPTQQDPQWQAYQQTDYREVERHRKQSEGDKGKSQSPPSDYNQVQRNNVGVVSPLKSSESSSPSVKSPSSDSRRSSGGNQALRSPIAQRIPSAPVALAGILYKQGSDGLRVWRKRWFVLSEYCLFYYKNQEEEKLLGSVLLPSYKVSACTAEDRVLRKFAFKLEHANMRTYILAAPDQEGMLKWVKALTMAAFMQNPSEQLQKLGDRGTVKAEDDDEVPGPTYANAPPKPRRSNEGYNSPSPDMYDPNYDLLKKPASHYSQGTTHTRHQDRTYQISPNVESLYTRSPQSPQQQPQYQQKRPYDTHNLSLPLTNTVTERLENHHPGTSAMYHNNPQSHYFDNRTRNKQQQRQPDKPHEQIYDGQARSANPFLQDQTPQDQILQSNEKLQNQNYRTLEQDRAKPIQYEISPESHLSSSGAMYNRDIYGEANARQSRAASAAANERLLNERRTPDAYGRSTAMSSYNTKNKVGDYEDVYAIYGTENEYGSAYAKPISPPQATMTPEQQMQEPVSTYTQEKTFSGPSVLRRKKMQSSGIQPPVPRPHSADFLEYESKNDILNKTMPTRANNPPKQPQRPKSSLDINSYYDPSSDRYYSEESYAEKMRQSAQYLQQQQQGLGPKNIQIPLAKYASGLAEKQLHSAYQQSLNNNYETEFPANRTNRDKVNYASKYNDLEAINSNWTLKEKGLGSQKEYLNRSGSVISNGSNLSGYSKEISRFDPTGDGFSRSLSARLSSTTVEKEGEKKVQQREESMKRLLEWKQRMLQSPLTRKSTPATISLAQSLNHSRQSLRSDQYKPKGYNNPPYNYSSDDEEEASGTELQMSKEMQAGRSQRENITSPILTRPVTPLAPTASVAIDMPIECTNNVKSKPDSAENTYENVSLHNSVESKEPEASENDYENTYVTINERICDVLNKPEENEDGYETNDSEAESETQEYTDDDLDEVLLGTEQENFATPNTDTLTKKSEEIEQLKEDDDSKSETPPTNSIEDHYLPMSPRKKSTVEPAHKTIIEGLSVFNDTMPHGFEDNPYVEMNLGSEDDDLQTYEIVCVNNGKVEPVYMELSNDSTLNESIEISPVSTIKLISDTASNFADTKSHTLKRKGEKQNKDQTPSLPSPNIIGNRSCNKINSRSDCSDADDEASKDISLDSPFSRFSISDTFRPASYYLGGSRNIIEMRNNIDTETLLPPPIPTSPPPSEELSDEALSQYVLEKLDQSNMSQDNSILKMLTSENQKLNTVKRKTTSLMIYGSRTSIHDTLSRGEKIRNNRASLNDKSKINEVQNSNLLCNSILDHYNSSRSIETDSLISYNADQGSSRLSLESDVSSKFDMAASNISSEVTSLSESEAALELRHSAGYRDIEAIMKRRPVSDDSFFDLVSEVAEMNEATPNVDLDSYLGNLEPDHIQSASVRLSEKTSHNVSLRDDSVFYKNNVARAARLESVSHVRCSSTPVTTPGRASAVEINKNIIAYPNISDQQSGYTGSQSSCSSAGNAQSSMSYYCKNFDEEQFLSKNLNKVDKVKKVEREKILLNTGIETNTSLSTTGFHSRESSAEHSAPYYYSDLSSQEHINILPTSHFLKNTNIHRKLNNQRRRGPLHKKNEISHIQNPIHNNRVFMSDQPFDIASAARSISVEFLSAADKDPDIDIKNIYESTSGRVSKIPDSMGLLAYGSKSTHVDSSSPESNNMQNQQANSEKVSSTNISSPCSDNSSNTVYYDAEADACAYENIMCQGDKLWDEDAVWRDNLRRVSHRHARSMDDLDALPSESLPSERVSLDASAMNSIKRIKRKKEITRNVTYVNSDIQDKILRCKEKNECYGNIDGTNKPEDDDVYVSLVPDVEQLDEGVYEQLAVESSDNSLVTSIIPSNRLSEEKRRRKFEIDREKLRQWDLMSSGLMKGAMGVARGMGAGTGIRDAVCSTDSGADCASIEASMTISGANVESNTNNTANQQALSKKAFLGSNTSIGRTNRDANIPVRAVSPRVRWVEDKSNDHYGSQQISISQQNLHTISSEDTWAVTRSPSRASQQPIRAVSPRVRRNTENDEMPRLVQPRAGHEQLGEIPTAGELLGRTHEELVLLLIQLRRRHAATHRAIEQCCVQITSIEDCFSSLKAIEREENLQRLDYLKNQLMELEHQYEKSKPLVQLVDNMVKLGSLYNRPGSTMERLERNQRLRQKVLAEHALEQQRWLESAAAGKPLETEAARARVAELWALEQELADEASILQGFKTDKEAIESLLSGVRNKFSGMQVSEGERVTRGEDLEAELARVHAMLALNSKKLEQTVADNARLERELVQLRRALHAQRQSNAPAHPAPATAMLEDEVSRVQQLVSALQRQRQELSRAVRHLTQQSRALQTTHNSLPAAAKRRPLSSWQETNLDTGHTTDHGHSDYDYDMTGPVPPGHYEQANNMDVPLYVDTRGVTDINSPLTSEDIQNGGFANLSNVEKQEIKTVRIVKRESERRQRDRERSLQPMADWPSNTITANLDHFLEEELIQSNNYHNYQRATSVPRTDFSKFEEYYSKTQSNEPPNYLKLNKNVTSSMELSPKFPSSPSLSNYDYSRDISSLSSSYNKAYDRSGYDRTISISTQYLNSPTDSARTLTNDPMTLSKTSSIGSLTRSHMELSPIFKSEAAKQIITEMSGDVKNGSLHRRQVPKEKRRHNTAPHHLSAKTLNELPKELFNQDKLGRSLDDADMERALRAPPDVVRSAIAPQRYAENTIDQLLAAPQKILIPERYIPEKPPELSPEEQQKRQEKVESIKKMLSSSSADPNKSPDGEEKKQRAHLLQMNQILAKQVTEMSKIIAVKAIEELPQRLESEWDDRSPEVELPIYQQRDNFFT